MNDEKNLNEENEEVSAENAETAEEVTEKIKEETGNIPEENSTEAAEADETADAEDDIEAEAEENAQEETIGEFIASDSAQSALGNNVNDISDGLTDEVTAVEVEDVVVDKEIDENKDNTKRVKVVSAIIAAVVVVIIAIVVVFLTVGSKWDITAKWLNRYNRGYVNVTGKTVAEIADAEGMDLKDFIEEYNLPKNLPGNTYETTAFYIMPFKTVAEKIYGTDVETLKEQMNIEEDIDDKTTYIEVIEKVPLKYMVSEKRFDEFKESYGFGDEVTLDTLWGEVRQQIDEKDMADRLEEEEAKKADDNKSESSGETSSESSEE